MSIALVTGGASGIGEATVQRLREQGHTVIAADIDTDVAGTDGIEPLDVTDEAAVDALVARIVAEHGGLDLAANVAGVSGAYANIVDSSTDAWRRTMAVNLDGLYFCMRAELRAGARSIVNVASSAAGMGVPGLAAYCASKHGVVGLTKTAALEVARTGTRVNCVFPGTIRTPMLRRFVGGDEQALEGMGRAAPVGRLGEPGEIAEAIAWLLSDAASYVSGSVLEVDGGVAAT